METGQNLKSLTVRSTKDVVTLSGPDENLKEKKAIPKQLCFRDKKEGSELPESQRELRESGGNGWQTGSAA